MRERFNCIAITKNTPKILKTRFDRNENRITISIFGRISDCSAVKSERRRSGKFKSKKKKYLPYPDGFVIDTEIVDRCIEWKEGFTSC